MSEILGKFVAGHDPGREGAWIAELRGVIVGSVFLVRTDDPAVAKLRLLYVEPAARGPAFSDAGSWTPASRAPGQSATGSSRSGPMTC
jgi:hypothetical protein